MRGPDEPWPRLRTAVDRSRDLAFQMTDAAAEMLRARRDPAAVAERRYIAARRRTIGWFAAGLLMAGVIAAGAVDIVGGQVGAGSVAGIIVAAGLFAYCAVSATQSLRALRQRRDIVRRLPPPQPQRRPVITALRPMMAELDAYSDALRGTIAVLDDEFTSGTVRDLRDETIIAADAAEVRLRLRAAELSALQRAATPMTRTEIDGAVADRMAEIRAGVDGYGRLVLAAVNMAAASRALGASAPVMPVDQVGEVTGRLTALTAGMRALVEDTDVARRPSGDRSQPGDQLPSGDPSRP